MPKRKVRKPIINRRSTSQTEAQVNFTFFQSKLFVGLLAIALIVIAFAVISAISHNSNNISNDGYRIDTTNLENDPSANQVIPQ